MLSINTNLSSLIAQNSMSSATKLLNQAVERMTTGYKINHAKDNAANYSISTNLTTKINAYMVAEDNCAMGLDMLSTANGSLDQISDKLTRLRDLQTQASNGTYGATSLNAINAEANALVDEINRLYQTAEYNGKKLFNTGSPQKASPSLSRAITTQYEFMQNPVTYTDEEIALMQKVADIDLNSSDYIAPSECISISTVEELEKLSEIDIDRLEYIDSIVLAEDLDLRNSSFDISIDHSWLHPRFNGNGHKISNIHIDAPNRDNICIFGCLDVKNLEIENIDIVGGDNVSVLKDAENVIITGSVRGNNNVSVTNSLRLTNAILNVDLKGNDYVAPIAAKYHGGSGITFIANNVEIYGSITGNDYVGGLWGSVEVYSFEISNTKVMADISGFSHAGTLIGEAQDGMRSEDQDILNNCCVQESNLPFVGVGLSEDANLLWESTILKIPKPPTVIENSFTTILQVGISSGSHSQIGLEFGFVLDGIEGLKQIGLDTTTDYLTILDNMLSTVNAKQTEFGAVENRLNSALDEISTQYENLVSSRSTIRDADIAEVSSEYIRQQILQQASATLLSTANQSPGIALQLI